MFLGIESGGLVPGVALRVTNHPDVAHFIAGGNNLLMVKAVSNVAGGALNAFEHVITYKAGTEALRLVKLIVVYLRLGVMVGRIA